MKSTLQRRYERQKREAISQHHLKCMQPSNKLQLRREAIASAVAVALHLAGKSDNIKWSIIRIPRKPGCTAPGAPASNVLRFRFNPPQPLYL
jgi:hypothetical protein